MMCRGVEYHEYLMRSTANYHARQEQQYCVSIDFGLFDRIIFKSNKGNYNKRIERSFSAADPSQTNKTFDQVDSW
jgi:hypothetical protein